MFKQSNQNIHDDMYAFVQVTRETCIEDISSTYHGHVLFHKSRFFIFKLSKTADVSGFVADGVFFIQRSTEHVQYVTRTRGAQGTSFAFYECAMMVYGDQVFLRLRCLILFPLLLVACHAIL
jgi:hypothetical protein